MATSREETRAGTLLAARYRLGDLLGRGGMAEVYAGVDERLERSVAVKLLLPEMAAREDVRQRFEAEARNAARLSHPNVVGIYDTGEDDDVPFLVMEKLPGETLADHMEADGTVDTAWLLRVAGDVLLALGAAHGAGLVHRDVKPANILIATDGCAKVADFGIAKSLEVAAASDLTNTNQLVGTPAYIAPERITGDPATPQADLYAVGVVLYEALAGQKPFSGNTPVATAYAIRHETPVPLAERRPDLPPALVAAVERGMARDPADRFSTAMEMAAALGVAAAGAPAAAPTDATIFAVPADATQVLPAVPVAALAAPLPLTGLFEDRRRLLMVAAAGILLALLLLGIAAVAGGGDGKDDTEPPVTATTAVTQPPTTQPVVTEPPRDGGRGGGKKDRDD